MSLKVIPTVFANSKEEFDERFKKLIAISKEIQIDFMDGKFVEMRSVGMKDIPDLSNFKGIKFEAHLMVSDPEEWIIQLKKKGFRKVIFHYESVKDLDKARRVVLLIHENSMKAWVAFNPNTNFEGIHDVITRVNSLDGVMLMGHVPGKENLGLHSNTLRRIESIKKFEKKISVQVDGGESDKTIREIAKAGADIVNTGSFVSNSDNPKKTLDLLKRE